MLSFALLLILSGFTSFSYPKTLTEIVGFSFSNLSTSFKLAGKFIPSQLNFFEFSTYLVSLFELISTGYIAEVMAHL